ncbi:MAG: periplasmic protease [Elusimicrobia bacterium]|nr:MAG: periplasmic protease [Elusimicrobiota bacterium]KAF0151952.1 MAG: periplasmic protease [Elusimicrobiota bacterium]
MKKTFIIVLTLAAFSAGAFAADKVIYGKDDRFDLYQVTDKALLKLADSTVGLFKAGDVTINGDTAALKTRSYAQAYSLCKEEPFYDQVNGAFCSGSLVAPDVIMTAGHCVRSESACTGTKFVFGFGIKEAGVMPNSVPANDVYSCAKLIGREEVGTGADWALIKLDRPVTGHAPLKYNLTDTLKNGDPLLVIGHPAGLPTKIAGGATVRNINKPGYFIANLDTYGGNSGSAVFNAKTHVIEGILVRGENDYVWKGSCRVSNVCTDDGCRGEDVTKLSAMTAQIPSRQLPELARRVENPDYEVAGNFPAYQLLESLSGLN